MNSNGLCSRCDLAVMILIMSVPIVLTNIESNVRLVYQDTNLIQKL